MTPTRIDVRHGQAWIRRVGSGHRPAGFSIDGEYVDAQSFDEMATALQDAHAGLVSAANQFAAMRESQQAGHFPEVHNNPEKFEEKAAAARAVLDRLGITASPAEVTAAAALPASDAGDGSGPPTDATSAGAGDIPVSARKERN